MSVTLFHNPRCSKSRQTLHLLAERGIDPEIVLYLETPPDEQQLASLLRKLSAGPDDIMRTGESDYKDNRDAIGRMSDTEKIAWLCQHPKVIQRPIVISGNRARIGRPPESVLEIID